MFKAISYIFYTILIELKRLGVKIKEGKDFIEIEEKKDFSDINLPNFVLTCFYL